MWDSLKMKVSINLGNEGMQTGFDVADALQGIGVDLVNWSEYKEDASEGVGDLARIVNQTIFDRNGNDVGRWSIDDTEIS